MRTTTPRERLIFFYLDKLRAIGVHNDPCVIPDMQREFKLGSIQAKFVFNLWRKNYNTKGNYKYVKTI